MFNGTNSKPLLERIGSKRSLSFHLNANTIKTKNSFCCNDSSTLSMMSDDNSSSSSSSSSVSSSCSRPGIVRLRGSKNIFQLDDDFVYEEHLEALRKVRQALHAMTKQQDEVSQGMREHLDKAKARLDARNETGAILSMKNVYKLRREASKVAQACDYLHVLEEELEVIVTQKEWTHDSNCFARINRRLDPKFLIFNETVEQIYCQTEKKLEDSSSCVPNDQMILSDLVSLLHEK